MTVPLNPIKVPGKNTDLDRLNQYVESNLDWNPTLEGRGGGSDAAAPVNFCFSDDAHLLKCAKPAKMTGDDPRLTIFGVYENQSLFSRQKNSVEAHAGAEAEDEEYIMMDDEDLHVILEGYTPSVEGESHEKEFLHANVPHFDWSSQSHVCCKPPTASSETVQTSANARIKMIDFSQLQKSRRKDCKPGENFMAVNSPAAICHFLRSVLKCGNGEKENTFESLRYGSHCASPWRDSCVPVPGEKSGIDSTGISHSHGTSPECDRTDQVIAILLCGQLDANETNGYEKSRPMGDQYFWDELEESELREFEKFRTGDACPNYYLYSSSGLKGSFSFDQLFQEFESSDDRGENVIHEQKSQAYKESKYTLLVYRHLASRPQFKSKIDNSIVSTCEEPLLDGCLWEKVKSIGASNERLSYKYRMVSPPYQDITDVCGKLLETLTSHGNMKILVEEAMKIPQWTAWPERNHYQSEYDEDVENIDSAYPASWTVFPLCHTFPASDVSKRKFIPLTCSFVPHTTKLLKSLGPLLRTALFSRLEPRTTLGAHTGWSDLANHILRVHIPLSVPAGNDNAGLCGTWVDGCVETHTDGRIISFDDSKTHRAFNYTEEERVVLIVDIARPVDRFPMGTATGGHTDELEGFINQFT